MAAACGSQQRLHGAVGVGPLSSVRWLPSPWLKPETLLSMWWTWIQALVPSARDMSLSTRMNMQRPAEEKPITGLDGLGDANRKCRVVYLNTCVCPSVTASLQKKRIWQILLIFFFFSWSDSALLSEINKQAWKNLHFIRFNIPHCWQSPASHFK